MLMQQSQFGDIFGMNNLFGQNIIKNLANFVANYVERIILKNVYGDDESINIKFYAF